MTQTTNISSTWYITIDGVRISGFPTKEDCRRVCDIFKDWARPIRSEGGRTELSLAEEFFGKPEYAYVAVKDVKKVYAENRKARAAADKARERFREQLSQAEYYWINAAQTEFAITLKGKFVHGEEMTPEELANLRSPAVAALIDTLPEGTVVCTGRGWAYETKKAA